VCDRRRRDQHDLPIAPTYHRSSGSHNDR
jgi:hypothetical protein